MWPVAIGHLGQTATQVLLLLVQVVDDPIPRPDSSQSKLTSGMYTIKTPMVTKTSPTSSLDARRLSLPYNK